MPCVRAKLEKEAREKEPGDRSNRRSSSTSRARNPQSDRRDDVREGKKGSLTPRGTRIAAQGRSKPPRSSTPRVRRQESRMMDIDTEEVPPPSPPQPQMLPSHPTQPIQSYSDLTTPPPPPGSPPRAWYSNSNGYGLRGSPPPAGHSLVHTPPSVPYVSPQIQPGEYQASPRGSPVNPHMPAGGWGAQEVHSPRYVTHDMINVALGKTRHPAEAKSPRGTIPSLSPRVSTPSQKEREAPRTSDLTANPETMGACTANPFDEPASNPFEFSPSKHGSPSKEKDLGSMARRWGKKSLPPAGRWGNSSEPGLRIQRVEDSMDPTPSSPSQPNNPWSPTHQSNATVSETVVSETVRSANWDSNYSRFTTSRFHKNPCPKL